jgi:hypothetical protein
MVLSASSTLKPLDGDSNEATETGQFGITTVVGH